VMVLRTPIVRLLFGTEVFQAQHLGTMTALLGWYMLAMPVLGLPNILLTGFYARGDTTRPSLQHLGMLVINLSLNLIAVRYLGILGFALAYVVSQCLATLWAAISVHKRVLRLPLWQDWGFFSRLALVTAGVAVSASAVFRLAASAAPAARVGQVLALGAAGLAGVLAFALLGVWSGVQEVRLAARWFRDHARRRHLHAH